MNAKNHLFLRAIHGMYVLFASSVTNLPELTEHFYNIRALKSVDRRILWTVRGSKTTKIVNVQSDTPVGVCMQKTLLSG